MNTKILMTRCVKINDGLESTASRRPNGAPPWGSDLRAKGASDQRVASVKPITLDKPENPWSAADMKSIQLTMCLQTTLVPFAFLAASALPNVGCGGGYPHKR